MTERRQVDEVKWHSCHCGCCGQETIYRGRYFWKGHTVGGHYLFSKHGGWGFHVGKFHYKSLVAVSQGVRDEYRYYPKVPRLSWHLCPCGNCSRFTVCFRGLRFWARWDNKARRMFRFASHKGGTVGILTRVELDLKVMEIARKSRPKKKRHPEQHVEESGVPFP